MLHTLEKGEYPKGHRYWSNATGDLNAALEDLLNSNQLTPNCL